MSLRDLVDTNVLNELVKRRPNAGVLAWAEQVRVLALSPVVIEEIHYGLSWRPNQRISKWFENFLAQHCQVLPITQQIAEGAGQLRGRLKAKGQSRSQADMLLAATALEHGLVLVSRNTRDFAGCGISLLNPFS